MLESNCKMPNYCSNYIAIDGPAEKLDAVWSIALNETDESGLLNAMVPIGPWDYETAVSRWGTKWDIQVHDSNLDIDVRSDGTAIISGYCESAWSPPVEACQTFMADNEDVSIELYYYEGGNDFAGSMGEGEIAVSTQPRTFWDDDELGMELNEHFGITDWLDEEQDSIEEEHLDDDHLVDPEVLPSA